MPSEPSMGNAFYLTERRRNLHGRQGLHLHVAIGDVIWMFGDCDVEAATTV